MNAAIGTRHGLDGIYNADVVKADAPLLVSVGLLLLGSWFIKSAWGSVSLRVFALIILLNYIVDLIVFKQFGIRVLFSSIQLYGSQAGAIWEQLQEFLGGRWKAAGQMTVLCIFPLAPLFPPQKPWTLSVLVCGLLTLGEAERSTARIPNIRMQEDRGPPRPPALSVGNW